MSDFSEDDKRVLRAIAEQTRALEGKLDTPPPPSLRLVGETVVHPIACRVSLLAERRGTERPACEWVRDSGGYSCLRCATHVGAGTYRHDDLARQFGDDADPARPDAAFAAICAEIEVIAEELIEAGEPPDRAPTIAGATLLLVARGQKKFARRE